MTQQDWTQLIGAVVTLLSALAAYYARKAHNNTKPPSGDSNDPSSQG